MFIIRKHDKETGERHTVKAVYKTEEEATEAITAVLTEYEYYKTLLMRKQGDIASNSFYSKYYYYNIIQV